ncbi:MAG: hypothetical protein WA865_05210, partial [Spirulinaceae cyanobacterium]
PLSEQKNLYPSSDILTVSICKTRGFPRLLPTIFAVLISADRCKRRGLKRQGNFFIVANF